ncbi:MAG: hypothetical protein LUD52_07085 [Opitutae bacterium]|nr:hypothetical protein [Opitutae bacterium]
MAIYLAATMNHNKGKRDDKLQILTTNPTSPLTRRHQPKSCHHPISPPTRHHNREGR